MQSINLMTSPAHEKTYTLTPSWKLFFTGYVLSVITIPIGVGIIAFYFIWKKHRSFKYIITDSRIEAIDAKYEQHVDLADINSVSLKRSWLQQKLGIGSLILDSSPSHMVLKGLGQPEQLKNILNQAIEAEYQRKKERQKTKSRQMNYKPGTMERLEYLTGLWQQGLISEEEYQKERKHIE